MTRLAIAVDPEPLRQFEDYGFFGPDSMAWKVFSHPSVLIAAIRATAIQMLEPNSGTGSAAQSVFITDPQGRFERTLEYFIGVTFGDGRMATEMSRTLLRIHARVIGPEPVTGGRYKANDPYAQLWVHLTAWHSVLYCYERFGPGPLSEAEDAQFWAECRIAGHMQTFDPNLVPLTRQGVRDYFAQMRPRLCATEPALSMINAVFRPSAADLVTRIGTAFGSQAAYCTIPSHLRLLMGRTQTPLVGMLISPAIRALFQWMLNTGKDRQLYSRIMPAASAIIEQARKDNPLSKQITTPERATHRQ